MLHYLVTGPTRFMVWAYVCLCKIDRVPFYAVERSLHMLSSKTVEDVYGPTPHGKDE